MYFDSDSWRFDVLEYICPMDSENLISTTVMVVFRTILNSSLCFLFCEELHFRREDSLNKGTKSIS